MIISDFLKDLFSEVGDISEKIKIYDADKNEHIEISKISYVKTLGQLDIEFEKGEAGEAQ